MRKQITMLERIPAFYSLLRYYAQLVSRIFSYFLYLFIPFCASYLLSFIIIYNHFRFSNLNALSYFLNLFILTITQGDPMQPVNQEHSKVI